MQALAPVFVVILLGYVAKRLHFLGDAFWPDAEKATYYLFFPAILVSKLAVADIGGDHVWPMSLATMGAVLAMAALQLAARRFLGLDGPAFSSVFQGAIRPNTYVGLAAAYGLFGDEGVTLSAVVLVTLIPTVNVLSVAVLSRYGSRGGGGLPRVLRELARNPLVLACLLGFAINLARIPVPESVMSVLTSLGSAALPIGLLAVGAGLEVRAIGQRRWAVVYGTAIKLVLLPLLAALGCAALGVTGHPRVVTIVYAALPVAVSSYILTRQMGGDERLMASIITVQTLAAIATMPLMLALLV